jgi:hypothetical protein
MPRPFVSICSMSLEAMGCNATPSVAIFSAALNGSASTNAQRRSPYSWAVSASFPTSQEPTPCRGSLYSSKSWMRVSDAHWTQCPSAFTPPEDGWQDTGRAVQRCSKRKHPSVNHGVSEQRRQCPLPPNADIGRRSVFRPKRASAYSPKLVSPAPASPPLAWPCNLKELRSRHKNGTKTRSEEQCATKAGISLLI